MFDRLLHSRRHDHVVRFLREATRGPNGVLFVCEGNQCRSPFAEHLLRRELGDRGRGIVVESAGFAIPDRPAPVEAIRAAEPFDVDLSGHRSRMLNPALLQRPDLVFVMASEQAHRIRLTLGEPRGVVLALGDLDPLNAGNRTIRDPMHEPPEVFEQVYSRIQRCVAELGTLLLPR
jgi:protein-tyrosine phosphatase